MSTKAGDLLTPKMKGAHGSIALDATDTHKLYYCLNYDAVLSIGDSGVSVLG